MRMINRLLVATAMIALGATVAAAQAGSGQPAPGSGNSANITNNNREANSSYNHIVGAGDPKPGPNDDRPHPKHTARGPATAADITAGSPLRDSQGVAIGKVEVGRCRRRGRQYRPDEDQGSARRIRQGRSGTAPGHHGVAVQRADRQGSAPIEQSGERCGRRSARDRHLLEARHVRSFEGIDATRFKHEVESSYEPAILTAIGPELAGGRCGSSVI